MGSFFASNWIWASKAVNTGVWRFQFELGNELGNYRAELGSPFFKQKRTLELFYSLYKTLSVSLITQYIRE